MAGAITRLVPGHLDHDKRVINCPFILTMVFFLEAMRLSGVVSVVVCPAVNFAAKRMDWFRLAP